MATDGKPVNISSNVVITLGETNTEYGEYNVYVGGEEVGVFKNVGATFGEYASTSATTPLTPFTVQAEMPEGSASDVKTQVKVVSINAQAFALNTDGKIEDTAVPVLVVNDTFL